MESNGIYGSLRSFALALLLTPGCGANGAPGGSALDLSSPKAAALAFLHGLADGNSAAACAASIGTGEDYHWVDGLTGLIKGLTAYDQALAVRFGQQAVSTDIELKQALSSIAQDPIMRFEGAILKEDPETAELDPALSGMRLAAEPPLYLRKSKTGWKVDLPAMRDRPGHDRDSVREYVAAGRALDQAAAAIRAGRYKTFEAAQQAVDIAMPAQ